MSLDDAYGLDNKKRTSSYKSAHGSCSGICNKYKATRPVNGVRYPNGQLRCQICEKFITREGTKDNGGIWCRCCGFRVRGKPRNLKFKSMLNDMTDNNFFERLIFALKKFRMSKAPISEKDLETHLEKFLNDRNLDVSRQEITPQGRSDLVVSNRIRKYCLELKKYGTVEHASQLDRYSKIYDGLILICWSASKPLRQLFEIEQKTAKIPVALIEVRAQGKIV